MTISDELKLNRFDRICLKKIIRVRWPMKISNYLTSITLVSEIIRESWWKYIGHIFRREHSSNLKVALTWKPEGRRRRGRPKETWSRTSEKEVKLFGWKSWSEAANVAQNRATWMTTCRASISTQRRNEQ